MLLIIGIIAAVAISRYTRTNTADLAAANTLKTHLRYAQLQAMGDTVSWGIEINSTSYTLQKNGTKAPINLPGENSATKTLQDTSIEFINFTNPITFSRGRGIPIDSNGERIENDQTLSVGSETITITIKKFTGFIQ
ncbi:MAG: hypothetical protein K9J85_00045 [Desulfobacteraceae bacterium]|nr:hypothetical protein [Desulfobacteraceae bacterium]